MIQDMGAKISPLKSLAFSTEAKARRALRAHTWQHIGATLTVQNNFRDLGAHLNMTMRVNSSTTTNRIKQATGSVKALRWLPLTTDEKASIIRTHILPKALYGAEIAHIPDQHMRALQTAILDIVAPNSTRRNPSMAFLTCSAGTDLDPEVALYVRRVKLFRRAVWKHPHLRDIASEIHTHYAQNEIKGTYNDSIKLSDLRPATMPGTAQRYQWKIQPQAIGPIGLLLHNTHTQGGGSN